MEMAGAAMSETVLSVDGQMHPIYEAMSVCSGTIQWLDRQEQESSDWEFCLQLAKLGSALEDFIKSSKSGRMADTSNNMLAFAVFCLGTITSMTRLINRRVRDDLARRSQRLRQQTEGLLNQVDELTERVDDIMETWEMSLDDTFAGKISEALKQIDSTKADIPAWRDALELISH
jgi:hypothetical protein